MIKNKDLPFTRFITLFDAENIDFFIKKEEDNTYTIKRYSKNNKRVVSSILGLSKENALLYLEGFYDAILLKKLPKAVQ